jgi:hypothetical protein
MKSRVTATVADSPTAVQRRSAAEMVGSTVRKSGTSGRVGHLTQLVDSQDLNNSPRMVAQRQRLAAAGLGLVGTAAQRETATVAMGSGLQQDSTPGSRSQAQRKAVTDGNSLLQARLEGVRRAGYEKPLQAKVSTIQREEDEELPLQARLAAAAGVQRKEIQTETRPNNTGLPDQLKSGIETLSGMSMDHVKVHYNSSRPAQLGALAYAQGSDIHVGPGQHAHLPHEAWHVVQQAQGRVRPTMQMAGLAVNDDRGLESEADRMGEQAVRSNPRQGGGEALGDVGNPSAVAQREVAVVQMRLGRLDAARVPAENHPTNIDHSAFGVLNNGFLGLHITFLPNRANGNTVHITAYELPNPGAAGPRSYNWYNPATGNWGGWTNGNPLAPGGDAALLAHVEGVVDFYLEPAPTAPVNLALAVSFPALGGKTQKEIEQKQKDEERRLRAEAEKAFKKAEQAEAQRIKRELQLAEKKKRADEAQAAEEKAAAEAEAQAAKEEKQRAKELLEQQRAEYAEDIAFGMELADMYDWSYGVVFEMAIQGAFREQVNIRKSIKETPSYIS